MSDRKLAFLYSPAVERLSYPPDCPFKTQRAGLTLHRLKSFGLMSSDMQREVAPGKATLADLTQFHTARYLDQLQRAAAGDLTVEGLHMGLGGPDTPVFKDVFEYGAWACGAGLTGADLLLSGEADVVFNLLGGFHHAMAERAAGFCFLNDMVLACMRLAKAGKRVLYLDLDAHHGDGVQAAFYQRKDVFTISMHESGKTLFPWGGFENETGEGPGLGYNVNVPLPAGTYDAAYLLAFDHVVEPLIDAFNPEIIVLELGMDILAGDPLTHLRLTNNVVPHVIERIQQRNCPVLVAGGGGYHVENTVRGWALAWRAFCQPGEAQDFGMCMGGVMLGSSEWAGGLRDLALAPTPQQRQSVDPELNTTIHTLIHSVFELHGVRPDSPWRATASGRT